MSIRVGLRPMGRALGLAAPAPPVFAMEYVFTEGTASLYDVMYDTIDGVGPISTAQSEATEATGRNCPRKLVRMSDGTLYEVYVKQLAGNFQIYVKQSADDGATWTDETLISTYAGMDGYNQYYPSIAVDSSDYLHVVWSGRADGYTVNEQIWYAKYTDSWSDPVRISDYAGMDGYDQNYPCIAVDSSDYLHVVWIGKATEFTTNTQIWYAKYTDAWQDPIRISTYAGMDGYTQYAPCIAVDSSDYLHVVWYGTATGYPTYYRIWYAKYTDAWQDPINITTHVSMDSQYQYGCCIAVDSSDYLHVVWMGKATGFTTNEQLWYAKYTDSWSDPTRISTYDEMEDYNQNYPSIAVDSSDYLHVVWIGQATGYTDFEKVWYALYTDAWATPECLQPEGQNKWPNLRWSRWP